MFNKFRYKNGNITIILIFVILVMVTMTTAISRRMSGHTQLLMLSDYTQISRYFLETYMSAVMQQFRDEVRDPNSAIAKKICSNITGEQNLSGDFQFKPELKKFINELAEKYHPKITFKDPKIKLTSDTEPIGYPDGIVPKPGTEEVEKIGTIELIVMCTFNNRDYTLKVQYPFSVVYRLTPIIKDFIVFADNIYEEQRADVGVNDKINLLYIEHGAVNENITPDVANINGKIRPFVLIGDPFFGLTDIGSATGNVYFGPSDKAIYLNLAGITPRGGETGDTVVDGNELFLVNPKSLGLKKTTSLSEETVVFPLGINVRSYGASKDDIPLKTGNARMGFMGFCKEFPELFVGANRQLSDFLGVEPNINDTYWSMIKDKDLNQYLSFASGIKVFGYKNQDYTEDNSHGYRNEFRNVFGNVFARFIILTFWEPGSAQGEPLVYSQNLTVETRPPAEKPIALGHVINFVTLEDPVTGTKLDYQDCMSRIISGMDFARYGEYPKMFMPINLNYESDKREIFQEDKFLPQDGFTITKKFDKFAETWFNFSDRQEDDATPLEKRIGRAFDDPKKFLDAVGYNNKDKQKFMVNGVVYVKGDLDLSKGMDLDKDSCSGGIVLVDGNITLGNITRGEAVDAGSFNLTSNQANGLDYFRKWSEPDYDNGKYYIGSDKILTFVCLKQGGVINVTGNVLLGVQLVNFTNPRGTQPQITWNIADKNKDLVFYGSLACNRLELAQMLKSFGELRSSDPKINAPFFFYPPVMTNEDNPPLAVQIKENMRSYSLFTGKEEYENYQ